ncbi:MAG: SRPBCC family protein [Phototrophicaceae bacterium]
MTTNKYSDMIVTTPSDTELVVSRTFNAPRDLVWRAWTQSEHLTQWWGPTDWKVTVSQMDFRVGGHWLYCMAGPPSEGSPEIIESWGKSVYLEITPQTSFVYEDYFVDSTGAVIEGMPVSTSTLKFDEQNSQTVVTIIISFSTKEQRDGLIEMQVIPGMTQTFDHLEDYLPTLA